MMQFQTNYLSLLQGESATDDSGLLPSCTGHFNKKVLLKYWRSTAQQEQSGHASMSLLSLQGQGNRA